VVTADALHTQHAHADWLVTQEDAAYLLLVKANQPSLHHQLTTLPWRTSRSLTTPATAATTAPRHCRTLPKGPGAAPSSAEV
jgi:hypothetical protein